MKRIPVARILVSIFFVALLLTPLVLKKMSARQTAAHAKFDEKAALANHGFYLTEVSHQAGIDFVHQGPKLDAKLGPIMPNTLAIAPNMSDQFMGARRERPTMNPMRTGPASNRVLTPRKMTIAR